MSFVLSKGTQHLLQCRSSPGLYIKHRNLSFSIIIEPAGNNLFALCKYCKRIVFGVYDIWRVLVFKQVGVDFNWRIPESDYFYLSLNAKYWMYWIKLKPHSAKRAIRVHSQM